MPLGVFLQVEPILDYAILIAGELSVMRGGILNAAPLGRIAFEASPEENASFARRTLLE